jgi:hypothetical protein
MYYAQISLTTGICFAETELHSAIDAPDMIAIENMDGSRLGKIYADGVFTQPEPIAAPRHITQLAFLNRFTDAEAIGIDLASIGSTTQAATMRRYLNKVNAAEFIDLDRADTRAGVQALEAAGALAVGRATTILDAEVQPTERYK